MDINFDYLKFRLSNNFDLYAFVRLLSRTPYK